MTASAGAFSFDLSGSVTDGPTFYNPVDQRRLSGGARVSFNAREKMTVTASVYRSVDRRTSRQEFTTAEFHINKRLSFGHELMLRARHVGTSFDRSIRDESLSLTYRVPLSLPSLRRQQGNPIRGRVVDLESERGVPGVVLRMGPSQVSTDQRGRFELPGPTETSYLVLDRKTIGLDRIPLGQMPREVRPTMPAGEPLDIYIVRSASMQLTVHVQAPTEMPAGLRRGARLQPPDSSVVAGILLELQRESLAGGISLPGGDGQTRRIRRILGHARTVSILDLPPGRWKVFAVGSSLPDGFTVSRDTLRIELAPGEDASTDLQIVPVERTIRMVGGGSVTLGSDLGAKQPAGVPADVGGVDASPDGAPRFHIVRRGETLASLARRFYDSTPHWARIWLANWDVLEDPDRLLPGMQLEIPVHCGPLSESERALLLDHR